MLTKSWTQALIASSAVLVAAWPVAAGGVSDTWRQDRPGVERHLTPADIPAPKQGTAKEAPDINNHPRVVHLSGGAPKVPPGFAVRLYATGLKQPRTLRIAPNGDLFVAESGAGRILVFHAADGGDRPAAAHVFAAGLDRPYGVAFYPPGSNPRWVYIGEPDRIVRMPYRSGALSAGGPPQVVVGGIPSTHHWTRDVVVADGGSLLYSVGSGSNEAGDMAPAPRGGVQAFAAKRPLGEAWGAEAGRAEVRQFDPEGHRVSVYATGLRNCAGMAVQPGSGAVWCVVNERDGLGDDTPPDYATAVRRGGFYGWPWYYIGGHPDPRLGGRPDLKGKVTVPDVLLQAHTAPLGIAFYTARQFPADYRGDAFVTMHGSWDRTTRVGYKVVRLRMIGGHPTGVVQDFMTGFVVNDRSVWGRPVGVAVGQDGSLLVSDDGAGSIWRVTWTGTAR